MVSPIAPRPTQPIVAWREYLATVARMSFDVLLCESLDVALHRLGSVAARWPSGYDGSRAGHVG